MHGGPWSKVNEKTVTTKEDGTLALTRLYIYLYFDKGNAYSLQRTTVRSWDSCILENFFLFSNKVFLSPQRLATYWVEFVQQCIIPVFMEDWNANVERPCLATMSHKMSLFLSSFPASVFLFWSKRAKVLMLLFPAPDASPWMHPQLYRVESGDDRGLLPVTVFWKVYTSVLFCAYCLFLSFHCAMSREGVALQWFDMASRLVYVPGVWGGAPCSPNQVLQFCWEHYLPTPRPPWGTWFSEHDPPPPPIAKARRCHKLILLLTDQFLQYRKSHFEVTFFGGEGRTSHPQCLCTASCCVFSSVCLNMPRLVPFLLISANWRGPPQWNHTGTHPNQHKFKDWGIQSSEFDSRRVSSHHPDRSTSFVQSCSLRFYPCWAVSSLNHWNQPRKWWVCLHKKKLQISNLLKKINILPYGVMFISAQQPQKNFASPIKVFCFLISCQGSRVQRRDQLRQLPKQIPESLDHWPSWARPGRCRLHTVLLLSVPGWRMHEGRQHPVEGSKLFKLLWVHFCFDCKNASFLFLLM